MNFWRAVFIIAMFLQTSAAHADDVLICDWEHMPESPVKMGDYEYRRQYLLNWRQQLYDCYNKIASTVVAWNSRNGEFGNFKKLYIGPGSWHKNEVGEMAQQMEIALKNLANVDVSVPKIPKLSQSIPLGIRFGLG